MGRILIGAKVRERRKALAVTQAALAARLGISASYLNLIESDRRPIAGALLKRIAEELATPLDEFGGTGQRRLADALAEAMADPLLAPLALDAASAAELASRQPLWAEALVRLQRAYAERSEAASVLADRLQHDPALAQAVHSLLTQVSAIRSAAEILQEGALPAPQRDRFVDMVADDSRRLSDVSRSLAGLFAPPRGGARGATPAQEVDDLLAGADNHFPGLEDAAQALRRAAGVDDAPAQLALAAWLERTHGVRVASVALPGGGGVRLRRAWFDAGRRVLELRSGAAESTVRFELARLAAQLEGGAAIEAALADAHVTLSPLAAAAARRVLAGYLAGALLMPYDAFLAAARALRYDVESLAAAFHASFEQACHRLATLRRPGAEGLRVGLVRCDASGRIDKRWPLPRLGLPAQGAGCPRWPLFCALQAPGALVRQLAQFPGGERCLLIGRTVESHRAAFGMPRELHALMLMVEAHDAACTAYADGLDLSERGPAVPVGPSCRLCVRQACAQRQDEPLLGAWAAPGAAP